MPAIKRITYERKETDSFLRIYTVEGMGTAEVSIRCNVRGDWKGVLMGTSGLLNGNSKSLSGFQRPKAEALRMASHTLDQWIDAEKDKAAKRLKVEQAIASL